MKHARKLAEDHGWEVTQELPRPLQSCALAKLQDRYSNMVSLLLETRNRQRKTELLFSWDDLRVNAGKLAKAPVGKEGAGEQWERKTLSLQDITGSNFREKVTSLFTITD